MSDRLGCGAAGGDSWPGVLPEHSDHAPQLLERLASGRDAAVQRSPGPRGGRSGWTSRAPACNAISEIRWASTSCISRAMRVRSAMRAVVGVQTLLGLGAQRTLAQREEELTSGPDEHAPRDRREHERYGHEDDRQRVGRGAVDGEDQRRTGSTAQRRAARAEGCGARRARSTRGARRRSRRSRTPPAGDKRAQRRAASAAATTGTDRPAPRRQRR